MNNENSSKDAKTDTIFGALYLVGGVLLIWIIAVPWYLLFGGSGAESHTDLTKFMLYVPFAIGVVVFLYFIKISRVYVSNKNKGWYDVFVHDPEDGVFAKFKDFPVIKFFYKTNKSLILLLLFSFIVFIPFVSFSGFLQQTSVEGGFFDVAFPQSAFPGEGFFTEQQVAPTAEFGLAVTPASPTETLFEIGIISLLLLGLGYVANIKRWIPVKAVSVLKWTVVPLLGGISHMVQHFLRYGNSDASLLATFNFGLLTAFVYLIFASVVVPLVYHDVNNAVFKLFQNGTLGSDASMIILFIIEAVLIALFFFIYRAKYSKKQKSVVGVIPG